ncbi:HAD family hydrolase [Vallitalea okinawensis]|uniref:HAD family hydrolase n=1 Tax=Vallitalea okinawensis TaxID=2078660 RepID=UPI000CFB01F7|nr:HAD family phosphatase [Vallitalea okinawensis]
MDKRFKLVCFDMDGTLIRETNSVKYLCQLSGNKSEVDKIEEQEDRHEIDWIEADYIKAQLFQNLSIHEVNKNFESTVKLIDGIAEVVSELNKHDIKSIIVTAGPVQVADVLGQKFLFSKVYGSTYEVCDEKFTGKIENHLGDNGKLECLISYCKANDIDLNECIAIGDSTSDIKVFEKCKKAIAINYSDSLIGKADVYLNTDSLIDVLEHIV